MRLHQNQIWKKDEYYLCIVQLERLSVTYKEMEDLASRDGKRQTVTKEQFCRLLKGAELMMDPPKNENSGYNFPPEA